MADPDATAQPDREAPAPRPAGLTALAVMNFIFAAIFGLSALSGLVVLGTHGALPGREAAALHETAALMAVIGPWLLAGGLITALLLLLSGFGYLHQRLVQGRYLGNAYAILALALLAMTIHTDHRPFSAFTVTPLVYPLVTLALINVFFRDRLRA